MNTRIDAAIAALREANPIPDADALERYLFESAVFPDDEAATGEHMTAATDRREPVPAGQSTDRNRTFQIALDWGAPSRQLHARLAAAVFLVVAALGTAMVAVFDGGGDEPDLAGTPPAVDISTDNEAIAEAFMTAWVEGDGDAVAAMFAADGTLDMFIVQTGPNSSGSAINQVSMLPALHDWYRAVGYEFHSTGCQEMFTDVPPGYEVPDVFCPYTFENELTRTFGREPLNRDFHLHIGDGEIDATGDQLQFDAFADIWQMFSEWVATNHPNDFERMYSSPSSLTPLLDQTSIALWERHIDEFVASPEAVNQPSTGGLTSGQYSAQTRMICAGAYTSFATVLAGLGPPSPYLGHHPAAHEAAARISEEALQELRALRPPEENQAHLDRVFSLMEQEIYVDRQLAAAASAGDTALVEELSRQRVGLTHQKDALGGRDFWYCPVNLGA